MYHRNTLMYFTNMYHSKYFNVLYKHVPQKYFNVLYRHVLQQILQCTLQTFTVTSLGVYSIDMYCYKYCIVHQIHRQSTLFTLKTWTVTRTVLYCTGISWNKYCIELPTILYCTVQTCTAPRTGFLFTKMHCSKHSVLYCTKMHCSKHNVLYCTKMHCINIAYYIVLKCTVARVNCKLRIVRI